MPEKDELYEKYRVFYEPEEPGDVGHPVEVEASYRGPGLNWFDLLEVDGAYFVLRPENDHHARVAMAAYAYSCRQEFPHLAVDIIQMIEGIEWEEANGEYEHVPGDNPGEATIISLRKDRHAKDTTEVRESANSDGSNSEREG